MANNLEMNLLLHDKFSNTMKKAQESTAQLEKHLEKINTFGQDLMTKVGLGFGFFKIAEFAKKSMDEYTNLRKEEAKLEQFLKNQNAFSKERVSILKQQREEYEKMGISAYKTAAAQKLIFEKYGGANNAFESKLLQSSIDYAGFRKNQGTEIDPASAIEELTSVANKYATKGMLKSGASGLSQNDITKLNKQAEVITDQNSRVLLFLDMVSKRYKDVYDKSDSQDPIDKFDDAMDQFSKKVGEFTTYFVEFLTPKLVKVVEFMDKLLSEHSESIKKHIGIIYETFKAIAEFFIVKNVAMVMKKGIASFTEFFNSFKGGADKMLKSEMIINANNVIVNGAVGGPGGVAGAAGGTRGKGGRMGSMLGSAAIPMMMAGMGLGVVSSSMQDGKGKTALDYTSGALYGAGMGASVGMGAGPLGAAIGAAIGGVVGLGMTYWKRTTDAVEKIQQKVVADPFDVLGEKYLDNIAKAQTQFKGKELTKELKDITDRHKFDILKEGWIGSKEYSGNIAYSEKMYKGLLTQMEISEETANKLGIEGMKWIKAEHAKTNQAYNLLANKYLLKNPGLNDPNTGLTGEGATNVTGIQPKQIIINIHDGLINNMVNTFENMQMAADEIERVVTQSILNGINGAQLLMPK